MINSSCFFRENRYISNPGESCLNETVNELLPLKISRLFTPPTTSSSSTTPSQNVPPRRSSRKSTRECGPLTEVNRAYQARALEFYNKKMRVPEIDEDSRAVEIMNTLQEQFKCAIVENPEMSFLKTPENLNLEDYHSLKSLEHASYVDYLTSVATTGINDRIVTCGKILAEENLGMGVFANKSIAPQTFIGFYTGNLKLISVTDSNRVSEDSLPLPHTHKAYLMELLEDIGSAKELSSRGLSQKTKKAIRSIIAYAEKHLHVSHRNEEGYSLCVDAEFSGNFTRYINHSYDPNVETMIVRRLDPGGKVIDLQLGIFSTRLITAGHQLLMNYGDNYWRSCGINLTPIESSTYTISP